ncbi:hypothetical protein HLB44_30540 [Aquincola sp. S2]|uniref:Uncharacterized protein n=1 Tax=Pseudaquabacterium terrae TaxID=2732868 RepID=A0ABX2ES33_9BURK|nr:hypothetical protein [Aquabacterium terrae]NRF71332.1 hypothetical protein [Aquabacterium terrae]
MNATHTRDPAEDDTFLNLVDFKWLMAGVGWWVDLSRLQRDRSYIDQCLQRALRSDSQLLRKRSVELLGLQLGSDAYHDVALCG